jgi:hypothetical protein
MLDWLHDRQGKARILADDDAFLDASGKVIGWLVDRKAYALNGRHLGWFEHGVLYDHRNCAVGFTVDASGHLPYYPGVVDAPPPPSPSPRPPRPELEAAHDRAGYGLWSDVSLEKLFG